MASDVYVGVFQYEGGTTPNNYRPEIVVGRDRLVFHSESRSVISVRDTPVLRGNHDGCMSREEANEVAIRIGKRLDMDVVTKG